MHTDLPDADVTVVGLYFADCDSCVEQATVLAQMAKELAQDGISMNAVVVNARVPMTCLMSVCDSMDFSKCDTEIDVDKVSANTLNRESHIPAHFLICLFDLFV